MNVDLFGAPVLLAPEASKPVAAELRPIPIGMSYRAILADPPWLFELYSEKGQQKSAQAQYRCMNPAQMREFAREIQLDFLCDDNAIMVMWATFPMLPDAIDLIRDWGFRYVTGGPWVKLTSTGKLAFGPGYVLRSAAELFLVGARGQLSVAVHDERNVILAEAMEHSRKPDDIYRKIDRLWPGGRKLELFCRRPHPGWDSYGDEIGGYVPASEVIQ